MAEDVPIPDLAAMTGAIPGLGIPPPLQRVIEGVIRINKNPERDYPWDDVLAFYTVFGRPFENEEAEEQFRKRFNPENSPNIPSDKAVAAMFDLVKNPEFCLNLQVESKVLDRTGRGCMVHRAADFRYMLTQLGEDIGEQEYDDFIREALGRGDDTFDIREFLCVICTPPPPPEK